MVSIHQHCRIRITANLSQLSHSFHFMQLLQFFFFKAVNRNTQHNILVDYQCFTGLLFLSALLAFFWKRKIRLEIGRNVFLRILRKTHASTHHLMTICCVNCEHYKAAVSFINRHSKNQHRLRTACVIECVMIFIYKRTVYKACLFHEFTFHMPKTYCSTFKMPFVEQLWSQQEL